MAACWMASRPPTTRRVDATAPSDTAQNTRCETGGCGWPPEVTMSSTSEPESDEVMKKMMITSVANTVVTAPSGIWLSSRCNDTATSSTACWAILISVKRSRCRAVPPKVDIQKNVTSDGTSRPAVISSRTVRPFEILATKMPTNGDHDIHQPQ